MISESVYFDDLNKICILDPKVIDETNNLKDKCKNFTEKLTDFEKLTDHFISLMNILATEVNKEKLKAIGMKNTVNSLSKNNEMEKAQLQALIHEKLISLEQLRIENTSLQRVISEQHDTIDQFTQFI